MKKLKDFCIFHHPHEQGCQVEISDVKDWLMVKAVETIEECEHPIPGECKWCLVVSAYTKQLIEELGNYVA